MKIWNLLLSGSIHSFGRDKTSSINWVIRLFINAIETEIIESLQVLSAKSIEIASNEQNDSIENESRIVGGRTGKRF